MTINLKNLALFLTTSALILLFLPIINLTTGKATLLDSKGRQKLFSLDIFQAEINYLAYNLGISLNSPQVIIGNDGWLFLGDQYNNTITNTRAGTTTEVKKISSSIGEAQRAWALWMKKQGASDYRIIIGPNKSSIYQHKNPRWARPINLNRTDSLSSDNDDIYIDPRKSLTNNSLGYDTYYRTDTHWNSYGAGLAFRGFVDTLAKTNPGLKSLGLETYEPTGQTVRQGGDLAFFLRIEDRLEDFSISTNIDKYSHTPKLYDYEQDQELLPQDGGNFNNMNKLLRIRTEGALNKKKVLWLSDSFGSAMGDYMAATFSDILKVHYSGLVGTEKLKVLIKEWNPDYVFVTVVERNVLDHQFTSPPNPDVVFSAIPIEVSSKLSSPRMHAIRTDGEFFYVVSRDPFLDYGLPSSISTKEATALSFFLTCDNNPTAIPIQIFWRHEGEHYQEQHSLRFNAKNGQNTLTGIIYSQEGRISSIRIDLDGGSVDCMKFKISEPVLGKLDYKL